MDVMSPCCWYVMRGARELLKHCRSAPAALWLHKDLIVLPCYIVLLHGRRRGSTECGVQHTSTGTYGAPRILWCTASIAVRAPAWRSERDTNEQARGMAYFALGPCAPRVRTPFSGCAENGPRQPAFALYGRPLSASGLRGGGMEVGTAMGRAVRLTLPKYL